MRAVTESQTAVTTIYSNDDSWPLLLIGAQHQQPLLRHQEQLP